MALESTADAVALRKLVMRPKAHGHLLCPALQIGQCYILPPKSRGKEESDSADGNCGEIKEGRAKKQAVFEVNVVPSNYNGEVSNMMSGNFGPKSDYINVLRIVCAFLKKSIIVWVMLSHVNYEGQGTVLTTRPWWTNETKGLPRLMVTEDLYVAVTGRNREKISQFV